MAFLCVSFIAALPSGDVVLPTLMLLRSHDYPMIGRIRSSGKFRKFGPSGQKKLGHLSFNTNTSGWLKQLNHVEVGMRGENLFNELTQKIKALGTAVASLNTVKRKGKANADLMDLEEDDEMDE
ncbi:hypothetical protein C8R47DRAFT_1083753 [Mycena vitilis]|nr:hypothetical protein C8R47DRAFT_1083753 [Mycena vitilis]